LKKPRLKKPKLSLLNLLARNDEPEKLRKARRRPRKLRKVRRSLRKPENPEKLQRSPERARSLDELENPRKDERPEKPENLEKERNPDDLWLNVLCLLSEL